MQRPVMRTWIDTDIGDSPDDVVALLCAAAHPSVEVVGVSTVGGDESHRAEIVRELVDVPIVVAGGTGLVPGAIAAAGADSLLAVGPLTNVADTIAEGVTLPSLTVMGGAARPTRHRGKVEAVEHNFGSDPLAARAVFAKTEGTLVVPLDVTTSMTLDPDDERALVDAAPVLTEYLGRWGEKAGDAPLVLHDSLALLALCGEPVVRIQSRHLVVERDGRLVQRADGPLHRIVVGSDPRAAIKRVLTLLG